MKKALEWFNEMAVGLQTATKWINIIEKVQKEAYNQAIDDAAKNAITCEDFEAYTGNTGSEYPASIIVDKESILKLKKT